MIRATCAGSLAALALAGHAHAARFAVGVEPDTPLPRVAAQLRSFGAVSFQLAPLHALVVRASRVRGVGRIHGVRWVEWLGARSRRAAFTPTDPLAARQWYLEQDHAFDFWPTPPVLPPVKVAIVDSGIDSTHPEFAGKILVARSFVGGTPADQNGHGTFVAGEIAASLNNNEGIAGIAFPAELVVAKVVRSDGSISLEAEVQAIRWAVDSGARVLNLSFGGLRDPHNRDRDTYSPLEAAAIDYAVAKGAVVVAAVGNSDQAPQTPWSFASYPAALPHVLGVSALTRDGSVPIFSDRDPIYNDLAAPGDDIFSTLPRALTKSVSPLCADQGYSNCGPDEFRRAEGTSFAAPQVAAAAALLLAQSPKLKAEQVTALIERTADDVNASNGCLQCPLQRDQLTGWGRLDIAKALSVAAKGAPPLADALETNDDAGAQARRIYGARAKLRATVDFWDDQVDVYAVSLRGGQKLTATLAGPSGTAHDLSLWQPRTQSISGLADQRFRLKHGPQRVTYSAPPGVGGVYYVAVKITAPGQGRYALTFAKR